VPPNLIDETVGVDTTEEAGKRLFEMFNEKVFDYPKPVSLIKYLLNFKNELKNETPIILDFFAGTGTTAQAVLELNNEDGGNRKFIVCTNNELNGVGSDLANQNKNKEVGEFGICQRATYPRISKVINGYKNLKEEQIEGLGGNLKYFKTSFVKNRPNKDQLKIEITKQCTEMLCLKEGIFNLKTATKDYKIFEQNDRQNNFYMAVFYDFANASLDDLKKQMNALKGEKILYCFTLLEKLETMNFKGWKDIKLEPIPQKILELYLEIFKK
jgi:adenine-specific DNA-methyltransferase